MRGQSYIDTLYQIIAIEVEYPDSALQISKQLVKDAELKKDSAKIAFALVRVGTAYRNMGSFEEAILPLQKAFEIRLQIGEYSRAEGPLEPLAQSYYKIGKLDSAFAVFYRGLRLVDAKAGPVERIQMRVSIANELMNYDVFNEARDYLIEANEIASDSLDLSTRAYLEQCWGIYNYYTDSLEESIIHYKNAFQICQEIEDENCLINNCNNLALAYSLMKEHSLAEFYYDIAIEHYLNKQLHYDLAIVLYNKGLNYNAQNESDSAIHYFEESLDYLRDFEAIQDEYNNLNMLARLYDQVGLYEKASATQKILLSMKDSILNQKKIESISALRTEYDTEKKEAEILLLTAKSEREEAKRNTIIAVASSILILLSFILYRYRQNARLARKEQELSKKKVDVLMGEQELKMYNALISGQDKERKRISRDLHDQVGSLLSALKFQFTALHQQTNEESKDKMNQLNDLIDTACEEVRRISHDLDSAQIAGFGLEQALEELSFNLDQISDELRFNYSKQGNELNIDAGVEREIYKIVQEVINNMLKHSQASEININLINRSDALSLEVNDNGIGFDVEKSMKKNGLGLSSLSERATAIGAQFHVDSQIGKGSSFHLETFYNS